MAVGAPPEGVDGARAAVIDAVVHMSDIDDHGGLPNVHGGSNLGPCIEAAVAPVNVEGQRANYEVDEVVFIRDDEAVVAFRVMVPMMPGGFAQTGRVLKVGDRLEGGARHPVQSAPYGRRAAPAAAR